MISTLYLHSRSDAKPLRIGVMIDDFVLAKFCRQILTDILASDFAGLDLVILNRQPEAPSPAPAPGKFSRYARLLKDPGRRRLILYHAFRKFDERLHRDRNPLEPVDCRDLLENRPRLEVVPIAKRFVHRFPPEALAVLRSYDLDVILRFGFNILRGEVLSSARHGIWSFHHGDNEYYRGGPALFWEVVEDNPRSGVILQVLTEKLDDGVVLSKSLFATARGLSPVSNLIFPYWGSTHFVIRKLHELHELGWDSVKRLALPPAPYRGKTEIYRAPTNAQMLRWLAPRIPAKAVRRLNPLRAQRIYHWRICMRNAACPTLLTDCTHDKSGFAWIQCPSGHFYADPFLIRHNGQLWLFFEDFLYGEQRGRICCAPVARDLFIGAPAVCLDAGYHLSYPAVFYHDGEVFMIPESAENQSVELWRATNFPFSWTLEKTLFRGSLVDTTPLLHQGRWYFFTTLCEPCGNAAFGALFSSSSLTGEWTRHPKAPISTDVRNARCAGAIVPIHDRLLRPVQDCCENYGRRIHVEEILELTPDSYESRHIHSIEPDWEEDLAGVHTYAWLDGVEVLDAVSARKLHEVAP
ncbi:MAG TPA: hypothetical protein VMF91_00675 [Bryobacteraceae bacterium]|nr:hypothetical protein [Bryobacteraceae bacterium]